MPELNVPLLRKVMEHILAHPEEWHQGSWSTHTAVRAESIATFILPEEIPLFNEQVEYMGEEYLCKTAYCFAGHAAVMSGAEFEVYNALTWNGDYVVKPDGENVHVRPYAVEVLGLGDDDAGLLFYGGNSLETLQDYVNQLIEHGRITHVLEY